VKKIAHRLVVSDKLFDDAPQIPLPNPPRNARNAPQNTRQQPNSQRVSRIPAHGGQLDSRGAV
jgi:hypothetical protein